MLFVCPIPKVTISSGGAQSVAEIIAGTNHEVRIKDIQLFFFGTDTVQVPIEIQAGRTSAGGTATTVTPVKMRAGPTNDFTFKNAHTGNATLASQIPYRWGIHPQTGLMMPLFEPFILDSTEGFAINIQDPGTNTDVCGFVVVEE